MARTPFLSSLCLSLATFCLFSDKPSAAQAVYGSIFGTVTDQTGAAIVGAKVSVTSPSRGSAESVTTNQSGNYAVTHLVPGPYRVTIESGGFKKLSRLVEVSADVGARMDAQLQLGSATQTVTVTGSVPQLKTDKADVATLFSERDVTDLPIFERNFQQFLLLTPGTQQVSWAVAASENPQGGKQIRVNGQAFGSSSSQLDGTENRDPILGIIVINPTLESVTEVKITSQNYDAEFGQALGGVVSSQTKVRKQCGSRVGIWLPPQRCHAGT